MVLALCLTLLPTAALAAETEGTAQTPPAVEKAADPANGEEQQENQPAAPKQENQSAEQEEQQEDPAVKQAVAAVQALIDALPDAAELDGMNDEDAMAVYEAFQTACDAYYDTLTEEQQAQLKNTEKLAALSEWFNAQVAPLENSGDIYPDVVDANGGITAGTSFSRNGPIVENSDDSTTFYGNQYYVVKESSNVTINGDLIIDSCTNNGLILCKGATLTVTGALIHKGGTFPIYGVSDSGQNAGRLVVKNSLDDGAAIRSAAADSMLNIYSGALTIKGGSSSKLVDGVELHNASKIYAATLSGNAASYKDWSEKSSLTGTSLVLEYCGHSSDYERYVDNSDGTHHMKCDLCGFEWTKGEYSKLDHEYDKYEKINETYHKATCVCGYEASAQEHKFETGPDNKPVWTSDGKGHVSGVCACGYSSGTVDAHDYDEFGTCKDCGFKPAFEDSKGNLYEYNGSDSIDALNEAIKKGETSFKLVNFAQGEGADAATVEAAFALETDANVTLDMNGKTLKASGGTPVLTVSSGALTVTGDAAIIQGGASRETYKPAIEVTGGSLVFEGDLTAQGGKHGNYDRQPAVKATGGTVEFKGALDLDGGLFLDSCERLASKLTQGRFYSDNNDQGQVYRVQIKDDYQHSYDLLADGYAFAKYDKTTGEAIKDEDDGNPVLVSAKLSVLPMNTDVIIVEHKHSIEEGQSACACGKKLEAGIPADDGTITYYETIDEAFANVKANETVKLMIDSDDWSRFNTIYVVGGPYTFDLNGHRVGHRTGDDFNRAFLQVGDPEDGSPGTLTVLDSSAAQTGYFYELELYNGDLTVESGSFYRYWESATTATGTMTFKGGTVDVFYATSANVETKLYGGTFGNVYNNIGGKPGDLLADNRAFFNRNNGGFVNGYDYEAVSDVVVKDHTHKIVDGSCECGFTCAHDWSDKNGVCKKANCGYHCPHPAGSVSNGSEGQESIYTCLTCNAQMAVKITASDSTVTYSTDFKAAMNAAENGTTVTLLADVSILGRTGISGDNTTVTLDLNGHKITSGWLDVGGKDTNGTYTACTLKIIGKGSYEPPMYGGIITVDMKATLDLSEWEGGTISGINISDSSNYEAATREAAVIVGPKAGTIGKLSFGNNQLDELKKTKLSGGSFNEIWVADFGPVKLGELLADGYAYQNADGSYVEYGTKLQGASIFNVKVVKCPHAKINEDGHCAYCNATDFVAQVTAADGSSSAYTDIAAAIAAADGGTVKLLANAGEITISSPLKLDLNGKTAAKLTVTGDVTLASLLPEGYAFKSGSTWISDLSGTELTNASMAKIPIKSMEYPTEMSMTYGGAGTLLVNVKKESGTGAVRFQWYKVEDGKATEVGSATAKNQFDLSALKLPAGQHTFRFSATCDGYKKMSQDIAVTVQRADIKSNLIMPPTAQENLTYTGQPQALITAGMTDYGTMQYSLTENGTYSQDSPVGTDAGAYTVWYRVIGDANHNDTAPASVAVRIGQKPLTITGVTAASKPYDGTTDAGITSVTFDGVTLDRGTDYTVTASFDDADVGSGKNVTATVTLTGQAAKNYALEQSSFPTTGSIIKAAAPDFTKETALTIVNGHEKTYTVTLPALPTLETPKEYGALTYEIGEIKLNDGYYTGGAKVENGKLTLPIQKNDVETTGSVGTVTVVIKSANYEDITLTVSVSAKNRITPTGDPTLSKNAITYGDALNTIALSGKLHDNVNNVDVDGTFEWVDGTHIPVVGNGTYAAEWKFTPTDKAAYTETTGTATVKVNKARQSGKVSMAGYTYGQAPSTPTLTDWTGDPNAQVTYYYSSVGNGNMQVWSINDPPALNAGTYRMYASIGDTDNYYGCEAVYCEFVVAKATPTYTAPTGLTAKYGQSLADVTLPDGWSWTDSSESVGGASTAAKTFQAKFTPTDTDNYNMVENIELEVMVNKADGRNLKTVELEQKYTGTSEHTYTPDWAGLPAGQDWTFSSEASIVLSKQDFAADGSLLTYAISGGKVGDKITITLKASCDNYEDFTITLNVTLTEKDDQQALRITGGTTVVYGQTLQLGTSGGTGSGAVTYTVTNGTGEATIDSNGVLTPVRIGSVTVTATKASDSEYNAVTSSPVEITITRATPTGEPAYTKITASGKTLADAALGIGTITPAGGTIAWDDPTTTEVVANKSYGWTYTPTDTNYTTLTGSIQLWHKSTSSGGGSYYVPTVPDMPMLYRGCTGDAVKTLQDKLNTLGYNSGNVDGIFGAKTYAAVTAFQKANGLGVDGIVGKLTWGKLYGVSHAMPVETTTVVGRPMVSYGSRGDAVRKLQELLNALGYDCGSVDGIFGSKTKAAVLAFQKANGLAADGIAGPLTWGKLV